LQFLNAKEECHPPSGDVLFTDREFSTKVTILQHTRPLPLVCSGIDRSGQQIAGRAWMLFMHPDLLICRATLLLRAVVLTTIAPTGNIIEIME
jgi:hypothetical protein